MSRLLPVVSATLLAFSPLARAVERGALWQPWWPLDPCILIDAQPAQLQIPGLELVTEDDFDLEADQDEPNPPASTLSPEQEKRYADFLKKLSEARRRDWTEPMEKELAAVAKTLSLTTEQTGALKEAGAKALEAAAADWTKKADRLIRRQLQSNPKMTDQMLAAGQVATSESGTGRMSREAMVSFFTAPAEEPAWQEGLKRILTAEQLTAWQKAAGEEKAKAEKEVTDFLAPMEERMRASLSAPWLNRAAEIRRTLSLDKERGEKLEGLARSMSDEVLAGWRKGAIQQLMALPADERKKQLAARGMPGVSVAPATATEDLEKLWKDRLATVLTAEERAKLGATKSERRARREKAMGQVMVQVLDDRLAFTARQREQLQPLAERLVKGNPVLFRDDNDRGYYAISREVFCAAGAKAKDEELKPILDEQQFRHWREFCLADKVDAQGDAVEQEPSDPELEKIPPGPPEPDDFENILSDFLYRKSQLVRRECLAEALLRVEDTGRVCGLTPELQSRLETAARGATEASLKEWRRDCEQNVRSNLEGANGQSLRQRLAGMEEYYFLRQNGNPPESQPVWLETFKGVQKELTEAQCEALKKEETARADYRTGAIIKTVMADFDQKFLLSAEQETKMEGLVGNMLKEYGSEIGSNFANSDHIPWYLQSYYKFIPVAGIPEKALKETLTKEQWEGWTGSREYNSCNMYWTNLEQNHARRQQKH